MKLKSQSEEFSYDSEDFKTYASAITAGARISFAFCSALSIELTPEFYFKKEKSKGFEMLEKSNPDMADWLKGFHFNAGIALFF